MSCVLFNLRVGSTGQEIASHRLASLLYQHEDKEHSYYVYRDTVDGVYYCDGYIIFSSALDSAEFVVELRENCINWCVFPPVFDAEQHILDRLYRDGSTAQDIQEIKFRGRVPIENYFVFDTACAA